MALIDIGCPAVDRPTSLGIGTFVDKTNAANLGGHITSVEIWCAVTLQDCEVATFYVVSGNNLSTRDTHTIGWIDSGSKQTFSGLDITNSQGDWLGIYYGSGQLERTANGGGGYWYVDGQDKIPCTNQAFSVTGTGVGMSLYGTGETLAVAPTFTTQAVSAIQETTCTGNGNITNTGGENPHTRGFCYMVGTSGDPTTANDKAYDTDSFGVGAYTKGITGLTGGTNYRVRAYGINSAGTGYGATVQMQTKKVVQEAESFSIVDSKVTSISKAVSEAFSVVDSWLPKVHLSEAFSIADSLVKSGEKAVAESCSVADSWIARLNLAEAFSIADSLVKSGTEQLAEAFSVADSLVKSGEKVVAEAFSIIDSWRMVMRFTETLKVAASIIKKHVITMMIRKIIIRVRGGSYESDIELED